MQRRRLPPILLLVGAALLLLSGIHPADRFTWWLEVAPALVAAPVLVTTYRRFAFTDVVYVLMLVHASILQCVGSMGRLEPQLEGGPEMRLFYTAHMPPWRTVASRAPTGRTAHALTRVSLMNSCSSSSTAVAIS